MASPVSWPSLPPNSLHTSSLLQSTARAQVTQTWLQQAFHNLDGQPSIYITPFGHMSAAPKSPYSLYPVIGALPIPSFQRAPQISLSISKVLDTDSMLVHLTSSDYQFNPSCLEHLLLTAHVHLPPSSSTWLPVVQHPRRSRQNHAYSIGASLCPTCPGVSPGPGPTHSKCPELCPTLSLGGPH